MSTVQIVFDEIGIVNRFRNVYAAVVGLFDRNLVPLLDLGIRVWMAEVFFSSGLTKIADWENTLFLFDFEYAVPLLPTAWTAFFATSFELMMPVFLVVGLATRFAALPLLAMAMVIQFVLGADNAAYSHVTHYYWMILLVTIVLRGGGKLSLDHLIGRHFDKQR